MEVALAEELGHSVLKIILVVMEDVLLDKLQIQDHLGFPLVVVGVLKLLRVPAEPLGLVYLREVLQVLAEQEVWVVNGIPHQVVVVVVGTSAVEAEEMTVAAQVQMEVLVVVVDRV